MRGLTVLLCVTCLAGCVPPPPVPAAAANDGFFHIQGSGTFPCPRQPVSLDGSHTDITLQGACTYVVMRGAHNDITIEVAPGATLEVTGTNNDITWRMTRPGAAPTLRNLGASNDFHRGRPVGPG